MEMEWHAGNIAEFIYSCFRRAGHCALSGKPKGKETEVAEMKKHIAGFDLPKIDSKATDGLLGVSNSLAYRVHKLERHFHNNEKWFGLAAVPAGETHRADRMAGGIAPFQLVAGNDTFGPWIQILGSADAPVQAGYVKYDLHRLIITTTNSTRPFIIQIVSGESAGIAAKIAAEDFTEFPYIAPTNNNDSGISDLMNEGIDAGVKVWARCCDIGGNGTNINFYFGIHEYIG